MIVAAGRGTRARAGPSESGLAKQYVVLAGEPVLRRTVRKFISHPAVDAVLVVIHPADRALYEAAIAGLQGQQKLLAPALGAETRQLSVAAGLDALAATRPDKVLIHDAARPFVSSETITRVIHALDSAPAAITAEIVTDTLQRAGPDGQIEATLDRTGLWRAQTPQGFRFQLVMAAHARAREAGRSDFTDDAAVAIAAGLAVHIIASEGNNVKLTTAEDFVMAERLLAGQSVPDVRVGHGFDVHRFTDGNHVWLCGVRIPHDRGVEAHSDGDVGLHALTDALLGAIADGDIGQHFRNTDPRWRGKASEHFLADAVQRVRRLGGRITSVDVTILAEAPKIGPYREAMRMRLAGIIGIDAARIGLKATTMEKLGAIGRGEGLAAMATATVVLPDASPQQSM